MLLIPSLSYSLFERFEPLVTSLYSQLVSQPHLKEFRGGSAYGLVCGSAPESPFKSSDNEKFNFVINKMSLS